MLIILIAISGTLALLGLLTQTSRDPLPITFTVLSLLIFLSSIVSMVTIQIEDKSRLSAGVVYGIEETESERIYTVEFGSQVYSPKEAPVAEFGDVILYDRYHDSGWGYIFDSNPGNSTFVEVVPR